MKLSPEGTETTEEIRALVALSLVPGIGSSRIRLLVNHCSSARDVFSASLKELARIEGIGLKTARAVHAFDDFQNVEKQIEYANQVGANLITYWSEGYPAPLRTIFDPPAFLWVRGTMPSSFVNAIAVVGTRKPSFYGKKVTEDLVRQLVELGFIIVSGLAYGIDAIAHNVTTSLYGCTIAVLGSGVDRIYPSKHEALAHAISRHGAVISEFPMKAKPDAANFPRRNRIISGLSRGTLLTEAYDKGGALITARMAIEQNRDVFAVPGSIYNEASRGIHRLIQRGHARLVSSIEDILDEMGMSGKLATLEPLADNKHAAKMEALNPIEKKTV